MDPVESRARYKLKELYAATPCMPLMVRLAWHDAGTFNSATGQGGCHGSIRFSPQINHDSNNGLKKAVDILELIKKEVPDIGYADLYQLAAVVAIEVCGGPMIPYRRGRSDAVAPEHCAPDGQLPDGHKGIHHLRDIFHRMGFLDKDIVTLSGAHCLGRAHKDRSGFQDLPWTLDPLRFDNSYYQVLLKQPSPRLLRLPTDVALLDDPAMRAVVEDYATNSAYFFSEYAKVHRRLSELGTWSCGVTGDLKARVYDLFQVVPCTTIMVQLAVQDACTYDPTSNTGGPDGTIRYSEHSKKARALLEPLKQEFPDVSYADLYQLAGTLAVQRSGGPAIPFRFGRRDAPSSEAHAERMFDVNNLDQLQAGLSRTGLRSIEYVALLGGLPRDGQMTFDNSILKGVLESKVQGGQALLGNEDTKKIVTALAKDQNLFVDAFIRGWTCLTELGVWAPDDNGLDGLIEQVEQLTFVAPRVRKQSLPVPGTLPHPGTRFEPAMPEAEAVPQRSPQKSPRWRPKGGTMPHPQARFEPESESQPVSRRQSVELSPAQRKMSNPHARGFFTPGTMPHPSLRFAPLEVQSSGQPVSPQRQGRTKSEVVRKHKPGTLPHPYSRYEPEPVATTTTTMPTPVSPHRQNPYRGGRAAGGAMPHPSARFEPPETHMPHPRARAPPGGHQTTQGVAGTSVRVMQAPGGNSQISLS